MLPESNLINDVERWVISSLSPDFTEREKHSMLRILREDILNITQIDRLKIPMIRVSEGDLVKLKKSIIKINKAVPVQYVTGKSFFCGIELEINNHVLIPRPETEELCELAVSNLLNSSQAVLDLCSGSGCIALALKKKMPNVEVYALEISKKAIELAKKNAQTHDLSINWLENDIFSDKWVGPLVKKMDVIISNPPYVLEKDKASMEKQVLDHEPHLALFVNDDDPLIFYHRILNLGNKLLKENGKLFVEAHENMCTELLNLFCEFGFREVKIEKDLQGKNRFVWGTKQDI